ncbi:hypothetical protein CE91St43_21220 [Oscillospiraceae bacterium]|nr:hypothetical protein CE91St43_21220 [Oscillospiraceae bacterium]
MCQQMIDRFIEEDLSLSARRTVDTKRYIVSRWNAEHATPMDEDAVILFLCDERRGALTDEQRVFAKERQVEMFACYRSMVTQLLLCGEMMRLHMVSGPEDFLRVFSPTGELLIAS